MPSPYPVAGTAVPSPSQSQPLATDCSPQSSQSRIGFGLEAANLPKTGQFQVVMVDKVLIQRLICYFSLNSSISDQI